MKNSNVCFLHLLPSVFCQRDDSEGVEASMVLVGKLTFVFFMYVCCCFNTHLPVHVCVDDLMNIILPSPRSPGLFGEAHRCVCASEGISAAGLCVGGSAACALRLCPGGPQQE